MSDNNDESPGLVKTQDFPASGPIEIDINNTIGPTVVELKESTSTAVEVRHEPGSAYTDWRGGLSGLLGWFSEQLSEAGIRPGADKISGNDLVSEAVRQTRVDMTGSRLVVRTPSTMPLRTVPLAVTVRAPVDSQVSIQTGAGSITLAGTAGRIQLQSGSGPISVDRTTGPASVRTGSGQLRLGAMTAGVQTRSGSGDIEIASVGAASSVVTGSGSVWLGAVTGDVLVRSGSGNVTLAEAASGRAELITGSGELRVSLRHGVLAEVDLTSSTGHASSELEVSDQEPEKEPELRVYGRTGTGNALITEAP